MTIHKYQPHITSRRFAPYKNKLNSKIAIQSSPSHMISRWVITHGDQKYFFIFIVFYTAADVSFIRQTYLATSTDELLLFIIIFSLSTQPIIAAFIIFLSHQPSGIGFMVMSERDHHATSLVLSRTAFIYIARGICNNVNEHIAQSSRVKVS